MALSHTTNMPVHIASLVKTTSPPHVLAVMACVPAVEAFKPDVFIAIGGAGFIPGDILAISFELYDDDATINTPNTTVVRKHGSMKHPGLFLVPWLGDNVY